MPLARAESQAMIQQVMGHAPSSATLDAIWELAGGNPFFTLELASTVGPDGLVAVPAGLYQAVDARLASLGRPLLGVLERAAIAGGELDADEFTVLSGLDEANAFAVLDDALAAGLLEVSGTAYRFRHRLVRDALVRKLAPHQRAAAHREAAERLGEAGAAPARVAYHFLAGGRGGHALPWLHRAATQAIAVSASATPCASSSSRSRMPRTGPTFWPCGPIFASPPATRPRWPPTHMRPRRARVRTRPCCGPSRRGRT
jgi:hypothetical protein